LSFNDFKMIEAMGLKIIASSPWIASPANQISWISTSHFKVISEEQQTDRQTGDLTGLLSFLKSRLKTEKILKKIAYTLYNLLLFILTCVLLHSVSKNSHYVNGFVVEWTCFQLPAGTNLYPLWHRSVCYYLNNWTHCLQKGIIQ
jgi:hypothetical protein